MIVVNPDRDGSQREKFISKAILINKLEGINLQREVTYSSQFDLIQIISAPSLSCVDSPVKCHR